MASYSYTYTSTGITFYVSGINAGDRIRFVVRLASSTSDRTIADVQIAATNTMTMWYDNRLTPGTEYVCNCGIEVNGVTTFMGSSTFTTPVPTPTPTRPNNWSWSSVIGSGKAVGITAVEWNNFAARINAFREYKGLREYIFTSAHKGNPITAAMANQLTEAIDEISGHGTLPPIVTSGSKMYASFFTTLASALNAIS